jgi:hypothetical protein
MTDVAVGPEAAGTEAAGAAGAGAAATGGGAARTGLGAGGGGGATAAGAVDIAVNITPQCTQNFALGWFSLPQAVHFIDCSSSGIFVEASKRQPDAGDAPENSVAASPAPRKRGLLSPDRRAPATPRGSAKSTAPRLCGRSSNALDLRAAR